MGGGGGVVFELCTASRVKTVDNLSRKKKKEKRLGYMNELAYPYSSQEKG